MPEQPRVIERDPQPYVGITARVTMPELGEVLPPLTPEVYGWLDDRGVEPAGPSFWKYNLVDMERGLEVEVAVPVRQPVPGAGRIESGLLPGGRFAAVTHVGPPSTLEQATADLLAWAEAEELAWDVTETAAGSRWGARLEEYLNDPDDGVEPEQWTTNLVFRLA